MQFFIITHFLKVSLGISKWAYIFLKKAPQNIRTIFPSFSQSQITLLNLQWYTLYDDIVNLGWLMSMSTLLIYCQRKNINIIDIYILWTDDPTTCSFFMCFRSESESMDEYCPIQILVDDDDDNSTTDLTDLIGSKD